MKSKPRNTVFYHISRPTKIKWSKVTERQFDTAYLVASNKCKEYSNCTLFSCVNPTKKGRRFYIRFQEQYFTALIPLSMNFANVVNELQTNREF